jgi:hypothetical protein
MEGAEEAVLAAGDQSNHMKAFRRHDVGVAISLEAERLVESF